MRLKKPISYPFRTLESMNNMNMITLTPLIFITLDISIYGVVQTTHAQDVIYVTKTGSTTPTDSQSAAY